MFLGGSSERQGADPDSAPTPQGTGGGLEGGAGRRDIVHQEDAGAGQAAQGAKGAADILETACAGERCLRWRVTPPNEDTGVERSAEASGDLVGD